MSQGRLASFRALSSRQRWDLVQFLVVLPLVRPSMKLVGFQRLSRFVAGPTDGRCDATAVEEARATAQMVDVAARRGLVKALCLERSLALAWVLRRRTIAAELRIGVQRDDDELHAHAWVDCGGVAVGESGDVEERFLPLISGPWSPAGPSNATEAE